mmetsp:Transcript_91505/g.191288  ORF Transcript_91505/g.191288 Transcript_91505/m.191288 type:complete len:370 (+) Transcript_91505:347-1456(+)|eukprot:CAMPEP_0206452196 /NCGR_PEP_ID=MMETSP0324_2-20121206/19808_1 /ASSEMBLY_ACC=CAM_ASM_000836 /TAXON_ID=2866 /ORGANISM="Crypthecodinium cohnii, Strain Seligo" /LENGTH=369 /DNA_ID=CAMNT_0053922253 /DNA_START=293 /DNA_END=1402 /DNA_ORIENTATION=+
MGGKASSGVARCSEDNDSRDELLFVNSRQQRFSQAAPPLLHIRVPRGCPWAAGWYRLVPDEFANGYPIWKADHAELWLHSMACGRWGIAGKREYQAGFSSSASFLFLSTPHRGALPHELPNEWRHFKPAWTLDKSICVEIWSELIRVSLQRPSLQEEFGIRLATSVVTTFDEGEAAINDASSLLFEGCSPGDAKEVMQLADISENSPLHLWNKRHREENDFCHVVPFNAILVNVSGRTTISGMKAALMEELSVILTFRRPGHKAKLEKEAIPEYRQEKAKLENISEAKHIVPPRQAKLPPPSKEALLQVVNEVSIEMSQLPMDRSAEVRDVCIDLPRVPSDGSTEDSDNASKLSDIDLEPLLDLTGPSP